MLTVGLNGLLCRVYIYFLLLFLVFFSFSVSSSVLGCSGFKWLLLAKYIDADARVPFLSVSGDVRNTSHIWRLIKYRLNRIKWDYFIVAIFWGGGGNWRKVNEINGVKAARTESLSVHKWGIMIKSTQTRWNARQR